MINIPSKHFNQRDARVDMLVIHSMANGALEGMDILDKCGLSSHYIIDFDGTTYTCVDEQNRAWHAGVSYWKGDNNINSRSIGIELCHQSLGQSPFEKKQIKSLIVLCQNIIKRHNIKADMVVGHSDISPTRKADPGKFFPWQELAENKIGLWYNDETISAPPSELLGKIGYNINDLESLHASAYAFCRHFLPQFVLVDEVAKVIENPYLKNNDILSASKFIQTLEKVAKSYNNFR